MQSGSKSLARGSWHRGVVWGGISVAVMLGVLQAQAFVENSYQTPSGGIQPRPKGIDPKAGTAVPASLRRLITPNCDLVVVTCQECAAHTILPALATARHERDLFVLLDGAKPSDVRERERQFPNLRFVALGSAGKQMNLYYTPRLYRVDEKFRWRSIQTTYLPDVAFLEQLKDENR